MLTLIDYNKNLMVDKKTSHLPWKFVSVFWNSFCNNLKWDLVSTECQVCKEVHAGIYDLRYYHLMLNHHSCKEKLAEKIQSKKNMTN